MNALLARLRVRLVRLALACVLGLGLTAGMATPLGPAGAVEFVTSTGAALQLEVNKGRLVRLDRPASTVFIADPEIADIQVKSPSLVYLMGKKPGETTLYAVDEGENVLASVAIRVNLNLSRLRDAIRALDPRGDVDVTSIDDTLVLEGVVRSALIAEDVRRLAVRIAGDEAAVINRLGVDAPNQVNLRVRIAEISRGVDNQLG